MIKQLLRHTSGGLGAQPPASPWSEHSEGTDVRRSAEGAGEGRSPKRSEGLWACSYFDDTHELNNKPVHMSNCDLRGFREAWCNCLMDHWTSCTDVDFKIPSEQTEWRCCGGYEGTAAGPTE